MKTIKQKYTVKAPVRMVWNALVKPAEIEAWGGGPAKMSARVGATFKLWGDYMWGKNIAVVKEKKLVQEWYAGKWPQPSITHFTLKQAGKNTTVIDFLHTQVPDAEFKDLRDGWKEYYLGPLKQYVEEKFHAAASHTRRKK